MLVCLPLFLDELPGKPGVRDWSAARAHYAGANMSASARPKPRQIEPQALNGTNDLELRVFANAAHRQAVLIARLDNLGKGASGAAMQNLD